MPDHQHQLVTTRKSFRGAHYAIVTNKLKSADHSKLFYYEYKMDVVASFCHAVEALGGHAHAMDMDDYIAYCQRRPNPFFDGAVNLGSFVRYPDLDGLMPSLSRFAGIDVFPCSGAVNLIAEDKLLAKMAARYHGLQCADTLTSADLPDYSEPVIVKPIYGGDSVDLHYLSSGRKAAAVSSDTMVEPYIPGCDVTVLTAWSPWTDQSVILGADKEVVQTRDGAHNIQTNAIKAAATGRVNAPDSNVTCYEEPVTLDDTLAEKICRFVDGFGKPLYARIDFRSRGKQNATKINERDTVFLEINSMPTLGGSRHSWWNLIDGETRRHGMDADEVISVALDTPRAVKSICYFLVCWKLRNGQH